MVYGLLVITFFITLPYVCFLILGSVSSSSTSFWLQCPGAAGGSALVLWRHRWRTTRLPHGCPRPLRTTCTRSRLPGPRWDEHYLLLIISQIFWCRPLTTNLFCLTYSAGSVLMRPIITLWHIFSDFYGQAYSFSLIFKFYLCHHHIYTCT